MNTIKKTPKLRFKGFTDDWEQRKLGEVVKSYSGGTPTASNKEYYGGDIPFIRSAEINSDTTELYITQKGLDNSSAKIVEKGTILYAMYGATSGEVGISKINGAINQAILAMIPLNYDGKIIAQYLRKNKESIIGKYLQGGQGNLSANIILELPIQLPGLEESNQIAYFLESVDNIITLHQRKFEKLKLAKKALLQKLFPKNGSQFPEIRFKGFTDAWEQRKLNDFGIATGGTSIESEFVDGGDYKVISIGSYSEESVYNDQGLRVNKSDKTKSRILNKNDLTMILNDKTASGNIIGRVLLIDQDNTYVYNQRTERIEVDRKNFLPIFLYHMLNAPEQRKYIVKASQGNTQIYVNWSAISNINYMIPQLLIEQEKIAYLFSLINKDITLHQRKLDHLISIKKGLLQQLFV